MRGTRERGFGAIVGISILAITRRLRAIDKMEADGMIQNDTWESLARDDDDKELLTWLSTVGHYRMPAGAMNSLGVQLDDGLPRFPR